MKTLNSKSHLIFVLLLLVLLPSLAILQYQWLGQVSSAERERMLSGLRTAASNFTTDFDREITHIFFNFQTLEHTEIEVTDSGQSYLQAYQKWQTNTRHPQLIKDLYVANLSESKQELLRFTPETSSFQIADWPEELTNLKNSWKEESKIENIGHDNFIKFSSNHPIIAKTPAIVINRTHHLLPRIKMDEPKRDFILKIESPISYLVVLLDLKYIQQQWLPKLINQYFATNNQLDYYVAIVNKENNNQLIYQSSQQFNLEQLTTSDIAMSFFSLRPEELEKFLPVVKRINSQDSQNNKINVRVEAENKENKENKEDQESVRASIFQTESTEIKKDGKEINQQIKQATISIVRTDSSISMPRIPAVKMMSFTAKGENANSWQLVVKHNTGSLDVAVANLRQRNVAISFSILLLLAVSMVMILISSRRAQNLAKQQLEFVAGVSHELRTPLAVICSAGENLADGVVGSSNQVKRYGGLIRDEGRRLTDMVEQILEFAGWQSHRRNYQLQPTQVVEVIENAVTSCKSLIADSGVEIVKTFPSDLPLVNADQLALQRAIQNLIANAIKYSGDSKWLKIEANFHVTAKQVQINVIDKGIGISAKELPHIFEPFYRGQEVIDAQIHGSGLGLSLVKQIVSACGGKVDVSSVVGQGSTFTLSLPLADTILKTAKATNQISEMKETTENL
ncbi:MAG: HAMP domain-containing histidine kinase [Acidobacteria bacterium]|nr:HAMP domain-containing histidine kinase [Acidobacteriota bacterium]